MNKFHIAFRYLNSIDPLRLLSISRLIEKANLMTSTHACVYFSSTCEFREQSINFIL